MKEARRQWRNFKTVQPLLEGSTDGRINPTQLLQRVKSSKFIDASKIPTGKDELVDLARIGKEFMAKKGGSDTYQKNAYAAGGVGIGGLGALAITNPIAALTTGGIAAGGLALNRGFQSVVSNQKNIDSALGSVSRNGTRLPAAALISAASLTDSK